MKLRLGRGLEVESGAFSWQLVVFRNLIGSHGNLGAAPFYSIACALH